MITEKRKFGDRAEDIVVKYVKQRGWKVLDRNFQKPWGEIDIVARESSSRLPLRGSTTVLFIEVKAQNGGTSPYFRPEDHFNTKKKERLIKTCYSYLMDNGYREDVDYRIDLAAVEVDERSRVAHVRYYKNAIS